MDSVFEFSTKSMRKTHICSFPPAIRNLWCWGWISAALVCLWCVLFLFPAPWAPSPSTENFPRQIVPLDLVAKIDETASFLFGTSVQNCANLWNCDGHVRWFPSELSSLRCCSFQHNILLYLFYIWTLMLFNSMFLKPEARSWLMYWHRGGFWAQCGRQRWNK